MISLNDFKVGQVVVVKPADSRDRAYTTTVEKIGRKYVTIEGAWRSQFGVEEYSPNALVEKSENSSALLYPSMEAYEEAVEKSELLRTIKNQIDHIPFKDCSIDSLREIHTILSRCLKRENFEKIQIGDVCVYPYRHPTNLSSATVEIVGILNEEVAVIKVLSVQEDKTGNKFLSYLKDTGSTMNCSIKYLKKVKGE